MESDLARLARLSQLAGALRAIAEGRPLPPVSRPRVPRPSPEPRRVEFVFDPALLGEM